MRCILLTLLLSACFTPSFAKDSIPHEKCQSIVKQAFEYEIFTDIAEFPNDPETVLVTAGPDWDEFSEDDREGWGFIFTCAVSKGDDVTPIAIQNAKGRLSGVLGKDGEWIDIQKAEKDTGKTFEQMMEALD